MVAHFALQELHILPRQLKIMMISDPEQYAFIVASCMIQGESRKKEQERIARQVEKMKQKNK